MKAQKQKEITVTFTWKELDYLEYHLPIFGLYDQGKGYRAAARRIAQKVRSALQEGRA
ncbi:MAG: hypothetical protein L0170_05440 [Acidobacteria bacterium]|nr:hypothetical protein [Acidobacteriota bacterium]